MQLMYCEKTINTTLEKYKILHTDDISCKYICLLYIYNMTRMYMSNHFDQNRRQFEKLR